MKRRRQHRLEKLRRRRPFRFPKTTEDRIRRQAREGRKQHPSLARAYRVGKGRIRLILSTVLAESPRRGRGLQRYVEPESQGLVGSAKALKRAVSPPRRGR